MSAAASAKKQAAKKQAGPLVKLVENEFNAEQMKKAYKEAELGIDKTYSIVKAAKAAAKPFIVWLYGPPGSGKSSPASQKMITEKLGLNIDDAAHISLDALIEGLEPFQRKSAAAFVPNTASNENKEKARKIAQSLYTQAMQAKIIEEKTLNDRRKELFKKAVEYELDIIYEFVVSDPSKDYFKNEIYDILAAAGKLDTYNIYVVYPFVPPEILKTRLEERPARQMASPTPFFRYVSPKTVDFFVNSHYDYFLDYILPRVANEDIIIPKDNKFILKANDRELVGKINKVVIFDNFVAGREGGSRRLRKRPNKTHKKSRT